MSEVQYLLSVFFVASVEGNRTYRREGQGQMTIKTAPGSEKSSGANRKHCSLCRSFSLPSAGRVPFVPVFQCLISAPSASQFFFSTFHLLYPRFLCSASLPVSHYFNPINTGNAHANTLALHQRSSQSLYLISWETITHLT